MSDTHNESPRVIWPTSLRRRWDMSAQTLWRWQREGKIPSPDICIAGRKGWSIEVIERIERGDTTKVAA